MILNANFAFAQRSEDTVVNSEQIQLNATSLPAPTSKEKLLVLGADFQLHAINNINDKDETFEFLGTLTLKWTDPRLAFDPAKEQISEKIYQGDYQINEVFTGWTPQVVLINQTGLFETSAASLSVFPDGSVTFSQMINAIAEVKLSMRRLPFDQQKLEAIFAIFGFDQSKILFEVNPKDANLSKKKVSVDQWYLQDIHLSTRELISTTSGKGSNASSLVIRIDVERNSFFMVRLVIFPLAMIVMLIWSVFWIDRSSMGDRINICFVGILTAVAYQIVLGDRLPQISYVTFINGFLNISFLMMSATIVVNLLIGSLDKKGHVARADLIESRSRWIFPITYLVLVSLGLAASFFLF